MSLQPSGGQNECMTLEPTSPASHTVFIDVDGTLVEHGRRIPPSAPEAIKRARAAGHLVFLCTGRAEADIPDPVREIEVDGAITDGGCTVRVGDELILQRTMTEEESAALLSYFDGAGLEYIIQSTGPSFRSPGFARLTREREEARREGGDDSPAWLSNWAERFPLVEEADPTTFTKAVFTSDNPETVELAQQALSDRFLVVPGSVPGEEGTTGELAPLGADKGTGIEAVLEHLGRGRELTVGIGDSHNDLEMMDVVQTGVAMGNSVDALRERADIVTTSVLEDGVANALAQLGLA